MEVEAEFDGLRVYKWFVGSEESTGSCKNRPAVDKEPSRISVLSIFIANMDETDAMMRKVVHFICRQSIP